jgi:GNAT superfamily N-acetyltransferase
MPPAKCPALTFHRGISFANIKVTALAGTTFVGELRAQGHPGSGIDHDRFAVYDIFVEPVYQRCGVATRLYEIAARHACDNDAVLASDSTRSDEADSFWVKQVAKGRAQCVRLRDPASAQRLRKTVQKCAYYALKSCPVETLSRRRRRVKARSRTRSAA